MLPCVQARAPKSQGYGCRVAENSTFLPSKHCGLRPIVEERQTLPILEGDFRPGDIYMRPYPPAKDPFCLRFVALLNSYVDPVAEFFRSENPRLCLCVKQPTLDGFHAWSNEFGNRVNIERICPTAKPPMPYAADWTGSTLYRWN